MSVVRCPWSVERAGLEAESLGSHISGPSGSAKSCGPARKVRLEKDTIFAYFNLNDIELQVYDQYYEMLGPGVIWNGHPLEPPVIPAKAPAIPQRGFHVFYVLYLGRRCSMKQNITLAIDKPLLKRARAIAAQRGTSVSGLLAQELGRLVDREAAYVQARTKALAYLENPFHLDGTGIPSREVLHDRQSL